MTTRTHTLTVAACANQLRTASSMLRNIAVMLRETTAADPADLAEIQILSNRVLDVAQTLEVKLL